MKQELIEGFIISCNTRMSRGYPKWEHETWEVRNHVVFGEYLLVLLDYVLRSESYTSKPLYRANEVRVFDLRGLLVQSSRYSFFHYKNKILNVPEHHFSKPVSFKLEEFDSKLVVENMKGECLEISHWHVFGRTRFPEWAPQGM